MKKVRIQTQPDGTVLVTDESTGTPISCCKIEISMTPGSRFVPVVVANLHTFATVDVVGEGKITEVCPMCRKQLKEPYPQKLCPQNSPAEINGCG